MYILYFRNSSTDSLYFRFRSSKWRRLLSNVRMFLSSGCSGRYFSFRIPSTVVHTFLGLQCFPSTFGFKNHLTSQSSPMHLFTCQNSARDSSVAERFCGGYVCYFTVVHRADGVPRAVPDDAAATSRGCSALRDGGGVGAWASRICSVRRHDLAPRGPSSACRALLQDRRAATA